MFLNVKAKLFFIKSLFNKPLFFEDLATLQTVVNGCLGGYKGSVQRQTEPLLTSFNHFPE